MYYPSCKNKGADQLREADLHLRLYFRICRLLVFPGGSSYVNNLADLTNLQLCIIKGSDACCIP